MSSTGLLLDGVFASEAIDSSGEILDIKGLDISDFDDGKGVANYEHKGHDGDTNGEEIVGKIVYAHKIHTESDCKNERETMFWEKVRLPFLYGVVRLYDGAGHEGAKALAAIVRDSHANDEPIVVGFSIEGSTMEKDNKTNRLKSTIARRVALTLRPCNKTAFSGLLADPNAPAGFEKEPAGPDILAMVPNVVSAKKSEHQDPRYTRLGGTEAVYGSAVTKAMSAGGYGGAPGTLTQGSALQREDRMKVLKASAHAAFRDWDRVTPFKTFLKMRMPEASDDFVEHFDDLVQRQMFRVRKAAEVVLSLRKDGKTPKLAPLPAPAPTKHTPAQHKPAMPPLTIQGKPVPLPPAGTRESSFDPVSGVLTTQRGLFLASTPSQPHPHVVQHVKGKQWVNPINIAGEFHKEMAAQRTHHQEAMKNWFLVNDRYGRGDLSSSVVSHAMAFAMMSPGVPVPMQETMYGHLVDALHATGHEAPTAQNWDEVKQNWMSRNRSGLPEHSRQHFRNIEQHIRAKEGKGAFIGYNKPEMFSKYFGPYLQQHHDEMVNHIRENRGDTHKIVRRLTEINGIAPKLGRYIMGMLGAGDIVVPDTHFTRHYFGGRPDAVGNRPGTSPDTDTQNHLKKALLDHAGSLDTMENVDKHYFANHDAVKAVLNDPTIGPYFKGKEQQSLFPAFWWHWISIPGHEKRIGMEPAYATNEGTDHAPFWDAVKPLLTKAEDGYDPELPVRTAMQHQRWIEQYGPVHALGLHYRYLVPKLLENDAKGQTSLVRKFEALQVDLAAVLRKDDAPTPAQPALQFGGRSVIPGAAEFKQGAKTQKLALLEAGPKEFVGVPADRVGHHAPEDLVRIPRAHTGLKIQAYPQTTDAPLRVDIKKHGVGDYNHHPETIALGHGFDFGASQDAVGQGHRRAHNAWSKTPAGQQVFVKRDPGPNLSFTPGLSEPRAEGVYHNLAHDFFDLGQYVPPVSVVRHPQTGQEHAIIGHVQGHELNVPPSMDPVLAKVREHGDLDRIAMMDMIMGNSDRHEQNFLVDDESGLHLIDHNLILQNYNERHTPGYWASQYIPQGSSPTTSVPDKLFTHPDLQPPLHQNAIDWALQLNPAELDAQLRRHEVPETMVHGAVERLNALQQQLKTRPDSSKADLWELPHMHAQTKLERR